MNWLQRDFSIYLRNVFDMHQADKLLDLPRLLDMASGLSKYLGIKVVLLPAKLIHYLIELLEL